MEHDRGRLTLNTTGDTGARLAETLLALPDAWTELVFPFATRADSRFLGVQLVKAKDETPVVFEVRGTRLVPGDSSTA